MTTDLYPSGIDSMFITFVHGNFISWSIDILTCISVISHARPTFGAATLWVPYQYFNDYDNVMSTHMVPSWSYHTESLNSAKFGDKFCALRTCITLLRDYTSDECPANIVEEIDSNLSMGYISIIEVSYNNILDSKTMTLPVNILDESYHITEQSLFMSAIVTHVTENKSVVAGSLVLYPNFPASEPCASSTSAPFGGRFGITFMVLMVTVMHVRVAHWNYY